MSFLSGFSAPGEAIYSSSTLSVGDGTWDGNRNDFLLPNIQGLNYNTMRYNGMGNRFAGDSQYKSLIIAHGILAALTFLAVVPAAILMAAFYYRNPRLALRLHIGLQILTVVLTIIVAALGATAVGSSRALTNPHHGIGIAILVLVIIQAIGGTIIHRIEKGRIRYYIPLKLMTHQWLGRAIALLAFAQIPIGLTLYGSPIYLFILYTLWMLGLFILFFVLTFQRHKRIGLGDDYRGSYLTESQTDTDYDKRRDHRHARDTEERTEKRSANKSSRFETLGGAFAGGLGVEALRHRYLQRRQRDRRGSRASESRFDNRSRTESVADAKSSTPADRNRNKRSWRDRLLGGQQDRQDERRQSGEGHGRRQDEPSDASALGIARLEEGRPLPQDDDHWREVERREAAQAAAQRNSEDQAAKAQYQQSDALARTSSGRNRLQKRRSRESVHSEHHEHSAQDSAASHSGDDNQDATGLAALPLVGGYFKRQRRKKELQRRQSQRQREYETRRLYSQQYGGDDQGTGRPPDSHINDFANEPQGRQQPQQNAYPNPPNLQTSASAPPSLQQQQQQQQQQLPTPTSPTAVHLSPNRRTRPFRPSAAAGAAPRAAPTPATNSLHVRVAPGGPPATITLLDQHAPASSMPSAPPSELVGLGAGAPVAVKVKVHPDGRHVTLRRVDAADEARAGEARAAGRTRRESSGSDATGEMRRQGYRRSQSHGAAGPAQPQPQPQPQQPYRAALPYPDADAAPQARLSQHAPPTSNPGRPPPPTRLSSTQPAYAQSPYEAPRPPYPPSPHEPVHPPFLSHLSSQLQQPQSQPRPAASPRIYPPPPPIAPPDSPSRGGGGGGGGGDDDGNGDDGNGNGNGNDAAAATPTTDLSAAYESSRRRRRAERARLEEGRRAGARVSFG